MREIMVMALTTRVDRHRPRLTGVPPDTGGGVATDIIEEPKAMKARDGSGEGPQGP